MEKKSYHHGNLREELIKAGLKIINEEGIANLSLRKVAAMCGVSHSAPKSHFQNKEEFVEAIKHQVSIEFSKAMEDVVKNNENPKEIILEFGIAYIQYFINNPDSFLFITNQKDINIVVSKEKIKNSNYEPFQIFQTYATKILLEGRVREEEIPKKIISLWAFVNGLAGLSVMKGFHYEGDWMEMVKNIMREK